MNTRRTAASSDTATNNRGARHERQETLIQEIEQAQLKTDVPEFGAGDTVTVQVKVKEGNRERLQAFQGVVIARRNRGLNSAFTVRKVSHGVGVERVFQLHSPLIDSIQVNRRGDVRRAKLYFLRERSGKSARIKEKSAKTARAAGPAREPRRFSLCCRAIGSDLWTGPRPPGPSWAGQERPPLGAAFFVAGSARAVTEGG